ncbi:hypothetical protein IJG89_02920 [Candidatus Saccharibacteria bacterium]|nr:hypothetical protein [Candidatus Saccharibacteria bacterium]
MEIGELMKLFCGELSPLELAAVITKLGGNCEDWSRLQMVGGVSPVISGTDLVDYFYQKADEKWQKLREGVYRIDTLRYP